MMSGFRLRKLQTHKVERDENKVCLIAHDLLFLCALRHRILLRNPYRYLDREDLEDSISKC